MIATSRPTAADDQELAERAGSGDHAAFNQIFERYKGRIYRFCLLMLGDRQSAEDVYQDVFINFYRACRQGQRMQNVHGYLITAARTRCINVLKSVYRLTSLEGASLLAYETDETASDTNEHLRAALLKIAPQYREAFLLFEFEGYSYEEIAGQLSITHDVVKNRIYRAKQSLQKILAPILNLE